MTDRSSQRPGVFVLMATRNGAEWLGEQIASIASQRGGFRLALAVCDDGSTDDTSDVVQAQAAANGLPLQWVRSELPGGGAGRNFFRLIMAVDPGPHEFVALCDQDDVWFPHKLERAVECLKRSDAAGYSAPVEAVWPDGRKAVLRQSGRTTGADHLFEGAGQGCSFVLTRRGFDRLQCDLRTHAALLMERVHYHDWSIYALARCHGERWYFDDRPCLAYRQHGANDTGARALGQGFRKRLGLIRSGWYGDQVRAIATLCTRVDAHAHGLPARYLCLADRATGADGPRRLRLALFVLRHGRRRRTDRAVLAWAALAGLLDADGA